MHGLSYRAVATWQRDLGWSYYRMSIEYSYGRSCHMGWFPYSIEITIATIGFYKFIAMVKWAKLWASFRIWWGIHGIFFSMNELPTPERMVCWSCWTPSKTSTGSLPPTVLRAEDHLVWRQARLMHDGIPEPRWPVINGSLSGWFHLISCTWHAFFPADFASRICRSLNSSNTSQKKKTCLYSRRLYGFVWK